MDYLLLHLHLLYSVSLFLPISFFLNVSFTAFLPDFLWFATVSLLLHFCFGVVWIAPALCLKSRVQCLQIEFESSSSPQFWSDGVCVFIKSLLLLNVQSVAFVQGKCWRQCNCNKCSNLSWIFLNVSWGGVHDDMYVWCRFYLLNVSIKEKSSGWLVSVQALCAALAESDFSPISALSSPEFLCLDFPSTPSHNAPCPNTSNKTEMGKPSVECWSLSNAPVLV